jgi:glycerol-3-phosphate O-acyltransferase
MPKFGIIKTIFEAVYSKKVDDCIIVPVSIGYDKVVETTSYVEELMGKPKERESLAGLFNSAFSLFQISYGRIDGIDTN